MKQVGLFFTVALLLIWSPCKLKNEFVLAPSQYVMDIGNSSVDLADTMMSSLNLIFSQIPTKYNAFFFPEPIVWPRFYVIQYATKDPSPNKPKNPFTPATNHRAGEYLWYPHSGPVPFRQRQPRIPSHQSAKAERRRLCAYFLPAKTGLTRKKLHLLARPTAVGYPAVIGPECRSSIFESAL